MKNQNLLNFGPKMPDFGLLGQEFQMTIVIFEINTPKFVKFQNLAEKEKCFNLGQKTPYLCIFEVEF